MDKQMGDLNGLRRGQPACKSHPCVLHVEEYLSAVNETERAHEYSRSASPSRRRDASRQGESSREHDRKQKGNVSRASSGCIQNIEFGLLTWDRPHLMIFQMASIQCEEKQAHTSKCVRWGRYPVKIMKLIGLQVRAPMEQVVSRWHSDDILRHTLLEMVQSAPGSLERHIIGCRFEFQRHDRGGGRGPARRGRARPRPALRSRPGAAPRGAWESPLALAGIAQDNPTPGLPTRWTDQSLDAMICRIGGLMKPSPVWPQIHSFATLLWCGQVVRPDFAKPRCIRS